MERPEFAFTGVILQEEPGYTSLCPELDVASQGQTVQQARDALLEAVTLYLETALENNLPWIRPVPRDEDPRFTSPEAIVDTFMLRVQAEVYVYA
jgi:predicted RNase H-like HicB family nuclease